MRNGRDVVVKVRRPGIEQQVAVDLELLRSAANLLERRSETARAVQARALAEESKFTCGASSTSARRPTTPS